MYPKKKLLSIILIFMIICSSALIISNFVLNNINLDSIPEHSNFIDFDEETLQKTSTSDKKIVKMINTVKRNTVYRYLSELVAIGKKPTRSKNCDKAAEYIYNNFKKMGLNVKYQEYKFPLIKGKNIIATLPGIDPRSDAVFIICAHYDTWWNTVGANDDASGVATMLTIAEIMSNYTFNHTMRFVGLSGHESIPFFTYGSTEYVKNAYRENQNIVGVLNLDMIGNTTKEGNAIQVHGPERTSWLKNYIKEVNEKYSDFFKVKIESFKSKVGADETTFINYGYDAVLLIQSNFWEPPNHQPEDDITTIDFDFLTNITKMILACAADLADDKIDLQVRILKPKEDYVYVFDRPLFRIPGFFNLRRFGLRGMTYIIGGITLKIDIITDDEVKNVYLVIDDQFSYKKVVSEPPFEFKIKKRNGLRNVLRGRHKIGIKVFTYSGLTAYDEMDVLFIP